MADLRGIVQNSLGRPGGSYDWQVKGVYNRTALRSIEPKQHEYARCLRQVTPLVQYLGGNALVLRYGQCRGIGNFYLASFDLIEAIRQMLQLSGASLPTEVDATVLADNVERDMRSMRNVILVPHSQGNLMAQQAINIVRRREQAAGQPSGRCLSAVSVAAPTSRNWPLTRDVDLYGHIVQHDLLLRLGRNDFKQVPTSLGSRLMSGVLEQYAGRYYQDWYTRFRLHLPFVTYFVVPETRGEIGQALTKLSARNCSRRYIAGNYFHTGWYSPWYPWFDVFIDLQGTMATVEYHSMYEVLFRGVLPVENNSVHLVFSSHELDVDLTVFLDRQKNPCAGTGTIYGSVGVAGCIDAW